MVARYLTLLCAFLGLFAAEVSAATCSGSAYYTLTFYSNWSNTTHPNAYPTGGKFSPLTGLSHKPADKLFSASMMATPGVKQVAETGNNSVLVTEIKALIAAKNAYKYFNTSELVPTGTTSDVTIHVKTEFPVVSGIAMIAPSPDWFVGFSVNLCKDNGEWMEMYEMANLQPWDAGTDNGTEFTSNDTANMPAVNMFQITPNLDTSFKVFNSSGKIPTLGSIMLNLTMTVTPSPGTNTNTTASTPTTPDSAHCPSGGLLAFVSIAFVAVFRAIF